MNKVNLLGKTFTAPSSWNELTIEQLMVWVTILSKNISIDHAFALAVVYFYKIPKQIFFRFNPVQRFQLVETIDFLYGENKLVNWMIPHICIWFRKYMGPDNRLSNCTIKEFRHLEMYYGAYSKTKKQEYLDLLIACLYRSRAKVLQGNDIREGFSEIRIRRNAGKMKSLNPTVRLAILFNYEGCRSYIYKKYPMVFKPGGKETNTLSDMEGLIKTLSGAKFGSFNETENTGIYLFLDDLSDKIEDYERNGK